MEDYISDDISVSPLPQSLE